MADVKPPVDLPLEPLDHAPDDPTLWGEVPLELLVRYSCVPVRREGERIVLAFASLDDPTKVDELEFLLERPIEPVLAPADRVATLLRRHHGGEILLEQASEGLRLQLVADDESGHGRGEAAPEREPDRAPRRLARPRRPRPPRLRHPHRDEGPRGPRQVPDRRRPLPRPRAPRQAAPRHDHQPPQGDVGARHRGEAGAAGRALPAAGQGTHDRLPRLDHAVDARRGRGHPHPRQGAAPRRVPQPAPRRPGLLRGRPAQAPQVHHRALRDGGRDRTDRQRQDHDPLRRPQRDRFARGQDHHDRGPGRVPDPRASCRCR